MAMHNVALVLLAFTGLRWFAVPVTASDWHYKQGKNGPQDWPGMCQVGNRQSPIDLDPSKTLPAYFESLVLLNYDRKVAANITNNGHTVMLMAEQQCDMVMVAGGLPEVYKFDQLHFHWKAEHTLRGKRLPLELHIVHHNRKYSSLVEAAKYHDGIAVLGVLFYITEHPNDALMPILDAVTKVHNKGALYRIPQRIAVDDMLPKDISKFYRYQGSLTTPNCDESVIWTVLTNLVPIGASQVEQFHKIKSNSEELKVNYRPIQKLDNRLIYFRHPRGINESTSMSSRLTLSWILVLFCRLSSLLS